MPTKTKNISSILIFSLLGSRLILFLFFQVIIALIASSWEISEKYWLLTATLTNIVGIVFLLFLFRVDGESYFNLFKINKSGIKKDILIFTGITILIVPIVFASNYFLSVLLWDDINTPTKMMFGTIDKGLVYVLLFVFPITLALAELATYFGYIMPRLRNQLKHKWLAVFLPIFFCLFNIAHYLLFLI